MGAIRRWCRVNFSDGGLTNMDNDKARAYCACSACGLGVLIFFSRLSFFFYFSLLLEWTNDMILRHFHSYFSYMATKGGWWTGCV